MDTDSDRQIYRYTANAAGHVIDAVLDILRNLWAVSVCVENAYENKPAYNY